MTQEQLGKAKAAKMTPEQRKEASMKMVQARQKKAASKQAKKATLYGRFFCAQKSQKIIQLKKFIYLKINYI